VADSGSNCDMRKSYVQVLRARTITWVGEGLYTVMGRLKTWIRTEKCVVVRTSQSVLTQTYIVQYSLLHT